MTTVFNFYTTKSDDVCNDEAILITYAIRIAIENPQQQFVFLTNEDTKELSIPNNVITVVIKKISANKHIQQFIFNKKLNAILKKYKATVLVNANQTNLRKKSIPQITFVKSTGAIISGTKYIAASNHVKNKIVEHQADAASTIDVVYFSATPNYKSLEWSAKEFAKKKYAASKEYFLYQSNTESEIISMLKAFSLFKKHQKSNMMLVIVTNSTLENSMAGNIALYKYKEHVKLLSSLTETENIEIINGAYACISALENYPVIFSLQAMQCNTPVIAANTHINKEILADAVLYYNADSIEDISNKLILMFKDETKRNQLIEAASTQVQQYNFKQTTDTIWKIIQSATNN